MTEVILRYFRPKIFVLAGYGGALIPQMKVGQVVVSNNYSSRAVTPFLRLLSNFDFAVFTTADEIASTPAERDRCARGTKGQVIDMETAAVAAMVEPREIPFVAVRAISDEYADVLPVCALAAGFDPARGRATPAASSGPSGVALGRHRTVPSLRRQSFDSAPSVDAFPAATARRPAAGLLRARANRDRTGPVPLGHSARRAGRASFSVFPRHACGCP